MYDFFVDLFCGNKSSSQKKREFLHFQELDMYDCIMISATIKENLFNHNRHQIVASLLDIFVMFLM